MYEQISKKQICFCNKIQTVDIDGEVVCSNCGVVICQTQTSSYSDIKSHEILFKNSKTDILAVKISLNLGLPQFALDNVKLILKKILNHNITQREAIAIAIVYSCRLHNIPRLLSEIFSEVDNITGKRIRRTEKSSLRTLNRIAKKSCLDVDLISPTKDYYLKSYLAGIEEIILKYSDDDYFQKLSSRTFRMLDAKHGDPSKAAKDVIIQCLPRLLSLKVSAKLYELK